jgi:hypothetical protein
MCSSAAWMVAGCWWLGAWLLGGCIISITHRVAGALAAYLRCLRSHPCRTVAASRCTVCSAAHRDTSVVHMCCAQVGATCKHFAAYSLEASDGVTRHSFDARVDDRWA